MRQGGPLIQHLGDEGRQKKKNIYTQEKKKGRKKSKYSIHVFQCYLWYQVSTGALELLHREVETIVIKSLYSCIDKCLR